MNETFKAFGIKPFTITDAGIEYAGTLYPYVHVKSISQFCEAKGKLMNGVYQVTLEGGKILSLGYSSNDMDRAHMAFDFAKQQIRPPEAMLQMKANTSGDGPIYSIEGVRGRHLDVYNDKCVITTKASLGSFITGNISDGEKTIYYSDCVGVQFKKSGMQIGYLQLETASSAMNNRTNNFFNENSFTFDISKISNEEMEVVANFVKQRVNEIKSGAHQPAAAAALSPMDELKKLKELLDMGIVTQEEFDAKKKQLLGL